MFTKDVGNATLPPAFESSGEETLFQKGHLGLHCLNSLHPDHCGFIQREDEIDRLKGKEQVQITLIDFIIFGLASQKQDRHSVLFGLMR